MILIKGPKSFCLSILTLSSYWSICLWHGSQQINGSQPFINSHPTDTIKHIYYYFFLFFFLLFSFLVSQISLLSLLSHSHDTASLFLFNCSSEIESPDFRDLKVIWLNFLVRDLDYSSEFPGFFSKRVSLNLSCSYDVKCQIRIVSLSETVDESLNLFLFLF